MSSKSLFKVQSLVAIILFTALSATGFFAQAQASPDVVSTITNTLKPNSLETLFEHYQNQNNNKCSTQDSNVDTRQQQANSIADRFSQMQDSSESSQLQANQKARGDDVEATSVAAQCQVELKAEAAQLIVDLNDAQSKAVDKVMQIQNAIIAQDEKLNSASAALRAAATAIVSAQTDHETQCRSTAAQAGAKKESDIEAAYQLSKASKINYVGASLAGADTRRKARRLIDIQNEYMTSYTNCLNGSTGQGGDIKKAQLQYADAQVSFKAQIATIKKETDALKQQALKAASDGLNAATAANLKALTSQDSSTAKCNAKLAALANDANNSHEQAVLSKTQVSRAMTNMNKQSFDAKASLSKATYNSDRCNALQNADASQMIEMAQACYVPRDVPKGQGTCPPDIVKIAQDNMAPDKTKVDAPPTTSTKAAQPAAH